VRDLVLIPSVVVVCFCATGGGGPLSDEPPEEGSVHTAVVKRIEPYGVVSGAELCRAHSSKVTCSRGG